MGLSQSKTGYEHSESAILDSQYRELDQDTRKLYNPISKIDKNDGGRWHEPKSSAQLIGQTVYNTGKDVVTSDLGKRTLSTVGNIGAAYGTAKASSFAKQKYGETSPEYTATISASQAVSPSEVPVQVLGQYESSPYYGAAEHYKARRSKIGGGGGCGCGEKLIGASELDLATVSKYTESLNTVVKQELFDDIINIMKGLGLDVSGASKQEIIKKILDKIPNAKRNSATFKEDAKTQVEVCKKIARHINKVYGADIIDVLADAPIICQQVAEVAESVSGSIHAEFLSLYNDVKKIIRNLSILEKFINDTFTPIIMRVNASNDPTVKADVAKYVDLHNLLLLEHKRQVEMLKGLLTITLRPAEVEITELVKHDKEFAGIITSIKDRPGTSRFGDIISKTLSDIGITASYALLVDEALKTVGATIDDYTQNTLKPLMDKISKALISGSYTQEELNTILQAQDLLYKNFYRSKEIASMIKNIKIDKYESKTHGGTNTDEESYDKYESRKSTLDKTIADRRRLRDVMFKTFANQIDLQFQIIVASIDTLASKIGKGIPISNQLDGFREALIKLRPIVMYKHMYVILIGYYNDAKSKELRESFLAQLKMINSYIDTLLEMEIYSNSAQYFRDIKINIEAIIKLIDEYADKIVEKLGSAETSEDVECDWLEDKKIEGGAVDEYSQVVDQTIWKQNEEPYIRKLKTIGDAIVKFDYFFKVGQIKDSLSKIDMSGYKEHYEDIRAESIADRINDINTKRAQSLKDINDKAITPQLFVSREDLQNARGSTEEANLKKKIKQKEAIIKFIDWQANTKINFWRVVEHIDACAVEFTNDIIKNFNELEDIKIMMDDTEVIYEWYNDKTGESLHKMFDSFPAYIEGPGTANPTLANNAVKSITDVKNAITAGTKHWDGKNTNSVLNQFGASENNLVEVTLGDTSSGNVRLMPNSKFTTVSNNHYYSALSDTTGLSKDWTNSFSSINTFKTPQRFLPGNPFIVDDITESEYGHEAIRHIKKVVGGLTVLKNILSIFLRIGSSFSKKNISKQGFISPTQVYKYLCEYLEASAFDINLPNQVLVFNTEDRIGPEFVSRGKKPAIGIPEPIAPSKFDLIKDKGVFMSTGLPTLQITDSESVIWERVTTLGGYADTIYNIYNKVKYSWDQSDQNRAKFDSVVKLHYKNNGEQYSIVSNEKNQILENRTIYGALMTDIYLSSKGVKSSLFEEAILKKFYEVIEANLNKNAKIIFDEFTSRFYKPYSVYISNTFYKDITYLLYIADKYKMNYTGKEFLALYKYGHNAFAFKLPNGTPSPFTKPELVYIFYVHKLSYDVDVLGETSPILQRIKTDLDTDWINNTQNTQNMIKLDDNILKLTDNNTELKKIADSQSVTASNALRTVNKSKEIQNKLENDVSTIENNLKTEQNAVKKQQLQQQITEKKATITLLENRIKDEEQNYQTEQNKLTNMITNYSASIELIKAAEKEKKQLRKSIDDGLINLQNSIVRLKETKFILTPLSISYTRIQSKDIIKMLGGETSSRNDISTNTTGLTSNVIFDYNITAVNANMKVLRELAWYLNSSGLFNIDKNIYYGKYQSNDLEDPNSTKTYNFGITGEYSNVRPLVSSSSSTPNKYAVDRNYAFIRLGVTAGNYTMSDMERIEDWDIISIRQKYGLYMRGVIAGFGGSFMLEDKFFVHVIKTMCAKIFTVMGMYSLFERPEETLSFNPVRMILGGVETPKIEEDIVELYLRLPLLTEFYRNLFGFDVGESVDASSKTNPQDFINIPGSDRAEKISMIPDTMGIFGGLIRLIFIKKQSLKTTDYTDDDLREVIAEINLIYIKLKPKFKADTVIYDIIHEFVEEINKRYGIITERERNKYEQEFGYKYDYTRNALEDYEQLDYVIPILPGEEESQYERPVITPSKKYETGSHSDALKYKESRFAYKDEIYKLFYRFRCMIDNYFHDNNTRANVKDIDLNQVPESYASGKQIEAIQGMGIGVGPFRESIKNSKKMLNLASNNENKFKIIAKLVRGNTINNNVEDYVKYVIFHETVISGLNTLSAIHTILFRFQKTILEMDIVELEKMINDNVDGVLKPPIGGSSSLEDIIIRFSSYMREKYFSNPKGKIDNFLNFMNRDNICKYYNVSDTSDSAMATYITKENVAYKAINITTNTITDDIAKFRFYILINSKNIMLDLLESVFGVGNDLRQLVTVTIDDKININFEGLKKTVEEIFDGVRYFMDLLRVHIDPAIFAKYSDKLIPGSYYWLQEQLMDKIIIGRPGKSYRADNPTTRSSYASLDILNVKINGIFQKITKEQYNDSIRLRTTTYSFDSAFSKLIFYDSSQFDPTDFHNSVTTGNDIQRAKNIIALSKESINSKTDSYVAHGINYSEGLNKLLITNTGTSKIIDPNFSNRYNQLYSWIHEEFTYNNSILFSFNQLIAKYLQQFYDATTDKIYISLISALVNGPFNNQVLDQNSTYPDMVRLGEGHGTRIKIIKSTGTLDPTAQLVNAYIQKNLPIMGDSLKTPVKTSDHAKNNTTILYYAALLLDALDTTKLFPNIGELNRNSSIRTVLNKSTLGNHSFNIADLYVDEDAGFKNPDFEDIGVNRFDADTFSAIWYFEMNTNKGYPLSSYPYVLVPDVEHARAVWEHLETDALNIGTYTRTSLGPFLYAVLRGYIEIHRGKLGTNNLDWLDKLLLIIKHMPDISPNNTLDTFRARVNEIIQSTSMGYSSYTTTTNIQMDIPTTISERDGLGPHTDYTFGIRSNPSSDKILFTSLSLILKNIVSNRHSISQANIYTIDNIADVSMYMKEKYRAYLPIFKNLFSVLLNKSQFLKKIMNNPDVHLGRLGCDISDNSRKSSDKSIPGLSNLYEPHFSIHLGPSEDAKHPNPLEWNTQEVSNKIKIHYSAILDTIIQGCQSIITSCDQVLREISDVDPKYFETHQESIREYKSEYDKEPFMPLSSLLYVLKNPVGQLNESSTWHHLLPFHNVGTPIFKFLYGTRLVLGQPKTNIIPEHIPGFHQVIELYNLLSGGHNNIDKSKAHILATNIINGLRYLTEIKHYKGNMTPLITMNTGSYDNITSVQGVSKENGMLTLYLGPYTVKPSTDPNILTEHFPYGIFYRGPLVDSVGFTRLSNVLEMSMAESYTTNSQPTVKFMGVNPPDSNWPNPVYIIDNTKDINAIISLTESNFVEDKMKEIARRVNSASVKSSELVIANIIDLNIVPINVHALMREIPLVNIFNYSYTFDRMLIDTYYDIGSNFADALIQHMCRLNAYLSDPHESMAGNTNYLYPVGASTRREKNYLIKSSKEMFIALLINPYRKILSREEFEAVGKIFRGDTNLQLERPKFLSDQLWNKLLFRELYEGSFRDRYNEIGPLNIRQEHDNKRITYIQSTLDNENDTEYDKSKLQIIEISDLYKNILADIGDLRFQTVFVRNLVFLVNVYRTIRFRLRKDLMYNKSIVLSSHNITREDNTELILNQTPASTRRKAKKYDEKMLAEGSSKYIE